MAERLQTLLRRAERVAAKTVFGALVPRAPQVLGEGLAGAAQERVAAYDAVLRPLGTRADDARAKRLAFTQMKRALDELGLDALRAAAPEVTTGDALLASPSALAHISAALGSLAHATQMAGTTATGSGSAAAAAAETAAGKQAKALWGVCEEAARRGEGLFVACVAQLQQFRVLHAQHTKGLSKRELDLLARDAECMTALAVGPVRARCGRGCHRPPRGVSQPPCSGPSPHRGGRARPRCRVSRCGHSHARCCRGR